MPWMSCNNKNQSIRSAMLLERREHPARPTFVNKILLREKLGNDLLREKVSSLTHKKDNNFVHPKLQIFLAK